MCMGRISEEKLPDLHAAAWNTSPNRGYLWTTNIIHRSQPNSMGVIKIHFLHVSHVICALFLDHDHVIKWKPFPRYWPFVWGIHQSLGNSQHKGQWRGALMFSFIWAWINVWVNNLEAGDLRRFRAHYGVIIMHQNNFDCLKPCMSYHIIHNVWHRHRVCPLDDHFHILLSLANDLDVHFGLLLSCMRHC